MKFLFKKIPPKYFFLSQFIIFFVGLGVLLGLNYKVNIQYTTKPASFSNGPVTTAPKSFIFNLDSPEDESIVFTKTILISGQTGSNMTVYLSSGDSNETIKADSSGTFSKSWELDTGLNIITVASFDETGEIKKAIRTIFYSKEEI